HSVNSLITPRRARLDGGGTPVATLSNPFPNGVVPPPGHNPSFQQVLYGQSVSSPVVDQPYAYVQQWNFNVQREVFGTAIEIAYAGSKGTHLLASGQQMNRLPDQYMSLGSRLQQQVTNPFYGIVKSGTRSTPTVPQGQLLLPYPTYTSGSVTR